METKPDPGLREAVRERYAQAAHEAVSSEEASCCGTVSCKGPISEDLYAEAEVAGRGCWPSGNCGSGVPRLRESSGVGVAQPR